MRSLAVGVNATDFWRPPSDFFESAERETGARFCPLVRAHPDHSIVRIFRFAELPGKPRTSSEICGQVKTSEVRSIAHVDILKKDANFIFQMTATTLRVGAILLLFIALKAAGNLSLAWGMKHLPQVMSTNPVPYIQAMFDPYVGLGVLALILALLVRMALLSLADLSYVLPVTAIGYVIATFLGKTLLHEAVSGQRWLGTALIFIGAALVGSTPHSTTKVQIE